MCDALRFVKHPRARVLLHHVHCVHDVADSHSSPQRVLLLCGKNVVKMAAGLEHSLALTDSGDLYSFGDNLRCVTVRQARFSHPTQTFHSSDVRCPRTTFTCRS